MEKCVLWLNSKEIFSNYRRLLINVFGEEFINGFKAYCNGPTTECRFDEKWKKYVDNIKAYDHETYWEQWDTGSCHKLISSRWVSGCGIFTRIYIRCDGTIVFSHDQAGYAGVHVLYPIQSIKQSLSIIYGRDVEP